MHQHVELIGNLGSEPDLRYTQSGTPFCGFSVAVTDRVKIAEKWQDKTTWFRIKIWGDQAKRAADWLHKGTRVHISGKIETSEYTDKDGIARRSWEVKAFKWNKLSQDGNGQRSDYDQRRPASDDDADFDQSFGDEDIPF